MTELLLCPFCGKKPQLLEPDDSNKLWSVSCLSCVSIDLEELTEERAIQKWNTRHYPQEVQQAIERMKPKRPLNYKVCTSKQYFGTCPNCDDIVSQDDDFCLCGQRLDWREE